MSSLLSASSGVSSRRRSRGVRPGDTPGLGGVRSGVSDRADGIGGSRSIGGVDLSARSDGGRRLSVVRGLGGDCAFQISGRRLGNGDCRVDGLVSSDGDSGLVSVALDTRCRCDVGITLDGGASLGGAHVLEALANVLNVGGLVRTTLEVEANGQRNALRNPGADWIWEARPGRHSALRSHDDRVDRLRLGPVPECEGLRLGGGDSDFVWCLGYNSCGSWQRDRAVVCDS